jgi:hypothetical protein
MNFSLSIDEPPPAYSQGEVNTDTVYFAFGQDTDEHDDGTYITLNMQGIEMRSGNGVTVA